MHNWVSAFESNVRKILVVDKEPSSRAPLAQILQASGFQVEESGCCEEAMLRLQQEPFDGLFLRFPLNHRDEPYLMGNARRISPELLIVVHDRKPTTERALAAVKAGVADYLTGQCPAPDVAQGIIDAFRRHYETVRRLAHYVNQALAAYYSVSNNEHPLSKGTVSEMGPTLTAGNVQLARLTRTLSFLDRPNGFIQLTKGESDILAVLMSHPGEVMSCWTIVREAWSYDLLDLEAKSIIRPHISRLRRKLTDAADSAAIVTIRGLGYMFVVEQPVSESEVSTISEQFAD